MALFTKDIQTMDDLYTHALQDIYYAEQQIVKALPKMIGKTTSPALKTAFESHLEESKTHVSRLEQAFELLGQKAKGATCPAIDGIIKEANEVAGDIGDPKVLDAALAFAAQGVEHYEITRYGSLIAWSRELNHPEVAALLQQTLAEEKAADQKLTDLAENGLNKAA
ncbi:ferritin-like domain-containing protein [Pseudoroseicyclus aestuarii]|uniref:Ferritin-like metal-binding protein YciE n=1 Tax=Pseudoroseicyclus aestuarii TaxID=1795041 RepID=A0A318STH6_9RHOB|nr:ferritin-like domain-containing protein [Pseudoroseicyclus aestuarii]PYE83679.1 ferritin-like metal-binding protein YciE [Pseudoroseicyclus aestuarii]